MRIDTQVTNFTAGELSPRLRGRTDVAKYDNGCETLLNFVVMPQGGATRRPGTNYVAACANQAAANRLVPFIFSTVQAYVIEFGNLTARFYANDGQVTSSGSPVQISTPYAAADLAQLSWVQSADTLFLFHPKYQVRLLTRTSATAFSISTATFRDGPYLTQNTTATTLTASGTSGSVTVTASSTVGINFPPNNPSAGTGFVATDVGRMIRLNTGTWGWLVITAVNSTTSVTATVQAVVVGGALGTVGTSATASWCLGKWSDTTGYPYVGTFWQNRLILCGTNNQPNAIECSITADFTNFAPTLSDSTVIATNAMSWIISDDQVNAIGWVSSAGSAQAAQLGIGTSGGENILQAQSTNQALTPSNVQAYRETSLGSAQYVMPLRIGKSILFVNRALRKLHEWTFSWQVNGYVGPDLMVLCEHLTRAGVAGQVYQQSPHGVIWQWLTDGSLIGLTYLRDQDVVGGHRHILGGQYFGGAPVVESAAVIPAPGGGRYDELWLTVLRTVNGAVFRSVEVMTPYFENMAADQAVFLDCSLTTTLTTLAGTATVSGLTNAAPADQPPQLTGSGTLVTSNPVLTSGMVGNVLRLNGGAALLTGFTSTTRGTVTVIGGRPLATMATAAAGAWTLTPPVTSVSGLSYLNGERVTVLADGQVIGAQTVAGGTIPITIGTAGASLVTAGLAYSSVLAPMPTEPAGRGGTGQGRLKRLDHLYIRWHETIGGLFGTRQRDGMSGVTTDRTEPVQNRSFSDAMGFASPLFSGTRRVPAPGGHDADARIIIEQTDPLPMTVLSVGARGDLAEVMPG